MFLCRSCLPKYTTDPVFVEMTSILSRGPCEGCGTTTTTYDAQHSFKPQEESRDGHSDR